VISAWLMATRGVLICCLFLCLWLNLIVRASNPFAGLHRASPSHSRPYPCELLQATECAKITLVLHHDYPGQVCSIAKALEVVGERWSLLIVRDVMNRRRRFEELQRSLGIARNVLAARLQRLLDEDILERRAYQANPERYEYFLTEKGLDLWPALVALLGWGDRHSPTPEGPPMLIVHKECGGPVSDRGICRRCGEVLEARDARALPGPGLGASLSDNAAAPAARYG
jgi:DNA-binding HxlR family transcriptional regulator